MFKYNNFIERSITQVLSFLKSSIFSDEYALRPGFLQARDARIKVLAILLFLLAVLFSRSLYFIIGIYGLTLLLAASSSVPLGFFLKRTWLFIPLFSLFIAIPALFDIFTPGEPFLSFKIFTLSFNITRQGIASAAFFFGRVLASASLCIILVLTTRHYILLKVLRIFKIPQVFVMTLGVCYRYIFLFIETIQNTYLAIKSRVGYIVSTVKGQGVVAWNIASLWQRSYQLNEDVYKAMLSRGWQGELMVLSEFKSGAIDWLTLIAAIIISGSIFYLNHRIA